MKILEDNNIKMYLSNIEEYKILSAEVQRELVIKAQAGDENAKEELVMSNLRYVVSYAKKYLSSGVSFSELISEGNMGLITAVEKFNPDLKIKFISYATWWIRHYIVRSIQQSGKLVRLPLNKIRLLREVLQEQNFLKKTQAGSDVEIVKNIKSSLGLSDLQYNDIMNASSEIYSLDQTFENNDNNNLSYLDSLVDENETTIDIEVEENNMVEILEEFINKIPLREREIISKRYGLNGYAPTSLKDLSEEFGITRERIRQLEIKGIERMRRICSEKIRAYETQAA